MDWRRDVPSFYRALLLAYPAEFRQEYGEEMRRLAAERSASENAFGLGVRLLGDAAIHAPREHLNILARDLRQSLRLLAKSPGFAITALAALTLGVGASIAIFSLVNAVLLRSLPFREPDRLTYLWTPIPRYRDVPREISPSYADVFAWRTMSHSFTEITAIHQNMFNVNAGGAPARVPGALVLGNFFRTLGASALLGRTIDESDDKPGAARVAVISYEWWRAQWNQDPGALGKTFLIGANIWRIIGVMPQGFGYPHAGDYRFASNEIRRTDVWIPAALTPAQQANRLLASDAAIGRLRPGVTLRQAQAEMSVIESRLDPLNPPEMRGSQSYLAPFLDTTFGPVRPLMRLLAGAVLLVLLIACGNVANLLMARSVARAHEMGVRTALGAPRARLIRQLLTESMLLSCCGGALGAGLGWAALTVLARLNPGDIPRFEEASIDGRVLLFALAISLATGLAFGALPAILASRANVIGLLHSGGARGVAGGSSHSHRALIVADVALAVVLLAGAGLFIRSYLAVEGEDKGFAPSTLTATLGIDGRSRSQQQIEAIFAATLDAVRRIPGVTAAGATNALPLSHHESVFTFRVDGFANRPDQTVNAREAAGNFFQAMQIRLLAGRYLNDADIRAQGQPAALVVSDSFARFYFPKGNALGGRVQRGDLSTPWDTVVGIVADVRHSSLETAPQPTIYGPSRGAASLAIRTALPPDSIVASVRKILKPIEPSLVLLDVQTMRQRTTEAAARRSFQTALLASFAAVAVFLALVGLYGLLAYIVRRRAAEIGIRMALGASRGAVAFAVVRQGASLTGAGLAIGLIAAAALARGAHGLLYGISAWDPVTFIAVPVLLILAAAGASFLPAWRAARIDPAASLREQ